MASVAASLSTSRTAVVPPWRKEVQRASISESMWIPLGSIPERLGELEAWRDAPVVVHCHHGSRSAQVCEMLLQRGFRRVENMTGGIEAWSLTVDASVPRY